VNGRALRSNTNPQPRTEESTCWITCPQHPRRPDGGGTVPNRHFRHFPADLRRCSRSAAIVCINPSDGGPRVRIHLPPARSLLRTCSPSSGSGDQLHEITPSRTPAHVPTRASSSADPVRQRRDVELDTLPRIALALSVAAGARRTWRKGSSPIGHPGFQDYLAWFILRLNWIVASAAFTQSGINPGFEVDVVQSAVAALSSACCGVSPNK
jgi:hypothetical protein